jgi:hypothetical protein
MRPSRRNDRRSEDETMKPWYRISWSLAACALAGAALAAAPSDAAPPSHAASMPSASVQAARPHPSGQQMARKHHPKTRHAQDVEGARKGPCAGLGGTQRTQCLRQHHAK